MLQVRLKKLGFITGARPKDKNTSHSALEVIKKYLLGLEQFKFSDAEFLNVGTALHERFLEDKFDMYNKLSPANKILVDNMLASLRKNTIVAQLMVDTARENKMYVEYLGVLLAVILDAKKNSGKKIGWDLKTTNARSYEDFVAKIIKLGYVRQGLTYKVTAKLDEFYFVGVQKQHPFKVFIVGLHNLPAKELKYAENELEFLLYFYKNYGKVIDGNEATSNSPQQKVKTNMATVKERLKALKDLGAEHKKLKREKEAIVKKYDKLVAKLQAALDKFPEKELYAEQLSKITV